MCKSCASDTATLTAHRLLRFSPSTVVHWLARLLMAQQQCSKEVRLSGRLDRIYSIDLVEAPSSVYKHA